MGVRGQMLTCDNQQFLLLGKWSTAKSAEGKLQRGLTVVFSSFTECPRS